MNKHNKKRNIGIVYELLIRYMGSCLIEGDKSSLKKAAQIIEKRFAKNTEIYKEFRLFNALAKSTVSSTEIAGAILSESRQAARRCNEKNLDREKSALIKDINYKLNDSKFFYRRVPNYTEYATIQIAMNEWRALDNSNLRRLVIYEEKIINWLMTPKIKHSLDNEKNAINENSNKLVLKLMTDKINEKYHNLTLEQKEIIKNYALYASDHEKLLEYFQSKKKDVLNSLNEFKKFNTNDFIGQKIEMVNDKIQNLSTDLIDDQSVIKFLTLTNLLNEIKTAR